MDFKCPLCEHSLVSLFAMQMHCINAHPKEFFTCSWCTVPFASLGELKTHAKNCSKFTENEPREGEVSTALVNAEKCLVCEGRFPSNEAAIAHYKEQHLNVYFMCGECQVTFQQFSSWSVHRGKCRSAQEDLLKSSIRLFKRTASIAFDGEAGPSAKEKANELGVSLVNDEREFILFIFDDCENACKLRQSVEFHRKYCNKRYNAFASGNRTEKVAATPSESNVNVQTAAQLGVRSIFACHLCDFEGDSRELAIVHHVAEHADPFREIQDSRENSSPNKESDQVIETPDESKNAIKSPSPVVLQTASLVDQSDDEASSRYSFSQNNDRSDVSETPSRLNTSSTSPEEKPKKPQKNPFVPIRIKTEWDSPSFLFNAFKNLKS